jgi:hypothetical protein
MPRLLTVRWSASLVTAVVLSALLSISQPAQAHPHQLGGKRSCQTVLGWTEQTVKSSYIGPANPVPVQDVGSAAVYYDNIYNAAGMTIGHAVGYVEAIYKRPSDGHIFTRYHESIELPGGTLADSGTVDRTAMLAGAWVHFNLHGTSGKFLGASGSRAWQIIPPLSNSTVRLRMTFCP